MVHVIGRLRKPRRRRSNTVALGVARRATQVGRILAQAVQAKFLMDTPGDRYEREADRVANRVVDRRARDPEFEPPVVSALDGSGLQRMCAECKEEEEDATTTTGQETVQRETECEEEEEVQRKARAPMTGTSQRGVASQLRTERSAGTSLPRRLQNHFEARFGADFSDVRIHTSTRAAHLAKSLNARAFTVGRNVVFGSGEFVPGTRDGQRLIAHELTHVLQQRGGSGTSDATGSARIQRWSLGTDPAPRPDWQVVPPEHVARVAAAEDIVRGLLSSPRCVNFFRLNCTDGSGEKALSDAFARARVFHRNADDLTFATMLDSGDMSYNTRAFRLGKWMIARALLHEMFHLCDPLRAADAEIDAENAVDQCRLYTPLIVDMSPSSGPAGTQVSLLGAGFGGRRGRTDQVLVNGTPARILRWGFVGGPGNSATEITFEVPAGATTGNVVVVNNRVRSNARTFTVV